MIYTPSSNYNKTESKIWHKTFTETVLPYDFSSSRRNCSQLSKIAACLLYGMCDNIEVHYLLYRVPEEQSKEFLNKSLAIKLLFDLLILQKM